MTKGLKLLEVPSVRSKVACVLMLVRGIHRQARVMSENMPEAHCEERLAMFLDSLRSVSRKIPVKDTHMDNKQAVYHINFPLDLLQSAIDKVGNLFLYGEDEYTSNQEALQVVVSLQEQGYEYWPRCEHVEEGGRCQGHYK